MTTTTNIYVVVSGGVATLKGRWWRVVVTNLRGSFAGAFDNQSVRPWWGGECDLPGRSRAGGLDSTVLIQQS